MTRRELIEMMGIDFEDDLTEEAQERIEKNLDDVIMVTHPDATKSLPVPDDQLCRITGWELHDPNIYALRIVK